MLAYPTPALAPGRRPRSARATGAAAPSASSPAVALAQTQGQLHDRLLGLTPAASPDLQAAWEATANALLAAPGEGKRPGIEAVPEQWLVLITCRDEEHQVELLTRCQGEGLDCRALLS